MTRMVIFKKSGLENKLMQILDIRRREYKNNIYKFRLILNIIMYRHISRKRSKVIWKKRTLITKRKKKSGIGMKADKINRIK